VVEDSHGSPGPGFGLVGARFASACLACSWKLHKRFGVWGLGFVAGNCTRGLGFGVWGLGFVAGNCTRHGAPVLHTQNRVVAGNCTRYDGGQPAGPQRAQILKSSAPATQKSRLTSTAATCSPSPCPNPRNPRQSPRASPCCSS
jgi:hypothetical protein